MARWANRILFALNGIGLIAIIAYFGMHQLVQDDPKIEYKDLITIVLAALAVILATVTLFIAAMAIWGYNSIRDESVKAAVKAAEVEAGKVAANVASSVASRSAVAIKAATREGAEVENVDELVSALQSGNDHPSKPRRSRRKVGGAVSADKSDGDGG